MADNNHRALPIEISGKFFQLRYDFNALVALEQALGSPEVQFNKLGFKGQRALIWAGLQHDKKQRLSLEEVGDLLTPYLQDPKVYGQILETAAKAYAQAFPEVAKQSEEADSKNVDATPGTGT